MNQQIRKLRNNERGASLVEYCLVAGLIALLSLGTLKSLGQQTSGQLDSIACIIESPDYIDYLEEQKTIKRYRGGRFFGGLGGGSTCTHGKKDID